MAAERIIVRNQSSYKKTTRSCLFESISVDLVQKLRRRHCKPTSGNLSFLSSPLSSTQLTHFIELISECSFVHPGGSIHALLGENFERHGEDGLFVGECTSTSRRRKICILWSAARRGAPTCSTTFARRIHLKLIRMIRLEN
jgi:hypothetical protein